MKKRRYDNVSTYFFLNKKSFIIATISGVFYNVLMVFVPILQGELIDEFQAQENVTHIILFALWFFLFVAFIQVNRYLKRYYVRDFANRMVLEMRTVSFENLITDDIEAFSLSTKGDIMNRNLADIKDSAEGVRKALTEAYDTMILMTGYVISLMIMDWKTTLIVLGFVILSVTFANVLKKLIYKAVSNYKKEFSHAKDVTLNSLKNELYYRGFGVSQEYYELYSKEQDILEKKSIRSMVLKGSLEPVYQAIAYIGLFFIIYFCGRKVMDELWLIGTFSAYLSTYVLVSKKAAKMGKFFNAITTFRVSWKRCKPYLRPKTEEKIIEFGEETDLKAEHLTFGFDNSFSVKDISFHLKKGESLGICGMIHSGKSTLGAALSGLYLYDGSITLCGNELKDIRNDLSEGFIAYAPAETEIFNDTIRYNVSFDNTSDVKRALMDSCLMEDLPAIKDGEDAILSHSSGNLSGGQQKRLQIARCLYQKPKLLILDDPFNAIDLEMSERITENILNGYQDSILVLINNQKEILEKMDHILFLKQNSYLLGTYHELMQDADFRKLIGGGVR